MTSELFNYLNGLTPSELGKYFLSKHMYPKVKSAHLLLSFIDKLRWIGIKWSGNPYKYEIRIMISLLNYSLHNYTRAQELFRLIKNSKYQFKSFKQFENVFGDSENKIKYLNGILKHRMTNDINVLILRCESNQKTFGFQWQDDLYETLKKSSFILKDSDPTKIQYIRNLKIDQYYTSQHYDLKSMFNTIKDNYDLVFVIGHGSQSTISIDFNGSKESDGKRIELSEFVPILNKKFNNESTTILYFCCYGEKVLGLSSIKNTISTNDEIKHTHILPFAFSFLSSYSMNDDFDISFNRAIFFTDFFQNNPNALIRK